MKRIVTWLQPRLRYATALLALVVGWVSGMPVAFGMANEVSTTTLSLDEATEYIAERTLRTALFRLATYQFAEKHTLPTGEGRTFSLTRYESLVLPQNPLTQGVTPSGTPMSISRVQAVSEQWGAFVTIYDVPRLTIAHNVMQKAIALLGEQAAKVFERENQRPLMAATNAQFAGAQANRGALTTTDYLTSVEIQKAVTNLRNNGAADWSRTPNNTRSSYIQRRLEEGGGTVAAKPGLGVSQYDGLIGIIDTDVEQDLLRDSTFVNASSYSQIRALYDGEVGKWLGVVWVRSNFMPKITLLTSPTTAGANVTGFTTGLSASTVYDVTVTRIRKAYGLEEAVSATISQDTGGGNDAVSIVLPTDTTYMYRVYIGSSAGTRYLVSTALSTLSLAADDITGPSFEGGQTIYITTLPTSGTTAPVAPASGVTVHVTWIFGMEAFGCVELDGLKAYLTEDKATTDDPLNQRRMAGWKTMYKCVVQNHSYLRKIESASYFAG